MQVFIRGGALHLIPPPAAATRKRELPPIALLDALSALRDPSVETRASDRIQKAIQRPIAGSVLTLLRVSFDSCLPV